MNSGHSADSQCDRLILASGSPRRRRLLSELGLPFEVVASGYDESNCDIGRDPEDIARAFATAKACEVSRDSRSAAVLGADTLIEFEGRILGKPRDSAEARTMLESLRNSAHSVITGLCVATERGALQQVSSVRTRVVMRDYSSDELNAYVDTGEPLDKAGAYAIQGLGGVLVAGLAGCYNNVVGLPLCETARLLELACGWGELPDCTRPDGTTCPREQG